jgi:hypothetical protein
MWHVGPLLCNNSKVSNYTKSIAMKRPINSNRERVFSTRSVPRCCKHDMLVVELVREELGSIHCELLL